uniref:Uncharacterized protein n=1 Tax=Lygus hesperus TaxID=30085 RepID=A0A146M649_LYGHE
MTSLAVVMCLVLAAVGLGAAAPLRLLRVRNMTFLFVETPDGEGVDVLYAPTGKTIASLPIGSVRGVDRDESGIGADEKAEPEEEYDPELDEPRVEPSVIQAPRTKSGCGFGHRKDRHGKCRLIW